MLEQAKAVHHFREALPVSRSSSRSPSLAWCKSLVVSLLPVFLAGVAQAGGFALLHSGCLAQGAAPSADAQAAEPALIPMPREMQAGAVLSLAHGISIAAPGNDAEDLFTAADLADALKQRGVAAQENGKGEVRIVLLRESAVTKPMQNSALESNRQAWSMFMARPPCRRHPTTPAPPPRAATP